MHLLPSASDRYHGNSYTWGYPGTGPANLASATLDLLRRAGTEINRADSLHHLTRRLAESTATQHWRVDELRPESDDASDDDDPYRHTSEITADLT